MVIRMKACFVQPHKVVVLLHKHVIVELVGHKIYENMSISLQRE